LPQSPQLYKQLLMVSGFDKYFQIARCYRDEDARGDRQLEFTQLDLEMSFVQRDDVLSLMERLFGYVFKKVMNYELPAHFRRIDYYDAMNTYGSDKPDLRFGCEIHDIGDLVGQTSFEAYRNILAAKGFVKAICAPKTEGFEFTRKYFDEISETAKVYGAAFVPFIKVGDGNVLSGSAAKYFTGLESRLCSETGAKEGDVIFLVAHENWKKCCTSAGAVRNKLGKDMGLIKPGFEFCWIVDFPLFEYNDEENHWEAAHHMFSMPQAQYIDTLEKDPGAVRGDLYDMVVNGYECASGSIRIHDVELQKRIFRICNFSDEEAEKKFGFLLNAFRFGPPPHGGIAPGIDRMVMIMCEQTSIKEVIAFPKNSFAVSPMDDCPNDVDVKQLEELHLSIVKPKKADV
ncbi:MAG: aspartate--tRNA ligase, partial [Sphaerochaetaceae bacterium]|nr:aspartate--tRNA ligase [Sphaerochaetaceae bacterium]